MKPEIDKKRGEELRNTMRKLRRETEACPRCGITHTMSCENIAKLRAFKTAGKTLVDNIKKALS